jgi:hypothetical protein
LQPAFFAYFLYTAAKKVSAAPHRGEANKPLTKQGKANAIGKPPKTNLTKPLTKQGKANTARTTTKTPRRQKTKTKFRQTNKPKRYPPNPLLFDPSRNAQLNNNSPYQH